MQISIQKQSGVALVVGLIVLLIMTLLGITSMSATTTELKIAGNLQSQNYAFQNAESAYKAVKGKQFAAIPESTWTSQNALTVATLATSPVTGGSVNTGLNITYQGCNNTVAGSDVTQVDSEGNNIMSNAYVHNVQMSATFVNASGNASGRVNQISNGKQTIVVMCP